MYIPYNSVDYYAYTGTHALTGELETVVFVHGASMDHTVWSHQSRYFAYHGYNVLALDLPGHKFSNGELLDTVESMAGWLNGVIVKTSGNGIHLVGHSMGALVTLEAAAGFDHDHRVLRSLSLVGFSYPMGVTPQLMEAAESNPSQAYSLMTQWSHTSKIGGEPVPGFWSPGMQMSMMENSAPGSIHANLLACDNYKGGEAAFDEINCPILFISGRLDKMAPAKLAQAEADRNDRARIAMIPDCGHSIMSESPGDVLDELKAFIRENGA
jgi:pimeloyl-ACP methyl ester carboxylesterase